MIVLYSRNNCQACIATKNYLEHKKVEFREINVEAEGNEPYAQYLVDQGHRAMPVVEVYNGLDFVESWSGLKRDKMDALTTVS